MKGEKKNSVSSKEGTFLSHLIIFNNHVSQALHARKLRKGTFLSKNMSFDKAHT